MFAIFISSGSYIVNINEPKIGKFKTLNQFVLGCQTSLKENANRQLYLGNDMFML